MNRRYWTDALRFAPDEPAGGNLTAQGGAAGTVGITPPTSTTFGITTTTPAPGTMTAEQQAELSAFATREKQQGRSAERTALADQLGCTVEDLPATLDAMKAARDAVTAAEAAKMTEADRLAAEAANANTAAQAAQAEAARVLRETRIGAAFVRAGVASPGNLTRLVDIDADPMDELAFNAAADLAVAGVKTEYPAMFGTVAAPAAPSSTPVGAPPAPGTPPPAPGGLARGAARAQAERAAQAPPVDLTNRPARGGNPFASS